ncbi:hypothetical protein PANDA_009275, partial [Ailuropoda melanoleuca]
IPAVVGESRALCSVESATRSCFQGVLSPTIKEEKFLSWLQSEPPILLWLPTSYRLSATEMVTHPVRCRICRSFPITGLRYSHSSIFHGQSFSKWVQVLLWSSHIWSSVGVSGSVIFCMRGI